MNEENERALQKKLFIAGGTTDARFDPDQNGRFDKKEKEEKTTWHNKKYDFVTAPEMAEYLEIGLTQAYDICKKINTKLSEQGYLTFRGKVPRRALMDMLPQQEDRDVEEKD